MKLLHKNRWTLARNLNWSLMLIRLFMFETQWEQANMFTDFICLEFFLLTVFK